mgnify:CR=1 FL=1
MGTMPEKKTLTVQRVLALVIAYITLSVGGGVAASLFLLPAVFGANSVAKAVIPSLSWPADLFCGLMSASCKILM